MNKVTIYIDSVDGETMYSIATSNVEIGLKFLEKYDHEGSTICLKIDMGKYIYGSEVYRYLDNNK